MLNGVKHFCTMAGGAHRYMIHCNAQNTTDPIGSQLLALIPHDVAGLSQLDVWNTLGMRGTVSPSMKLDKCLSPKTGTRQTPGRVFTQELLRGSASVSPQLTLARPKPPWTSRESSVLINRLPPTRHGSRRPCCPTYHRRDDNGAQ
ncbi:MAG: hypothetical protein Ct9H300mP11_18010 [Chloroflexota bacterium]|nr:MAG: hypothetical protein Ct9H300mP11_18010 [Chloroflexota bacterium]